MSLTVLSAEPVPAAAHPVISRLRPPAFEPPYDDEGVASVVASGVGARQGALALVLPPGYVDPLPVRARGLRLLPPPVPGDDGDFGSLATPRSQLPPPGPWAGRLVQALLEVLAGARPVPQLLRWTSHQVYADLDAAVTRRAERSSGRPAGRPGAATVQSVHLSEPDEGVAEVCAVVRRGGRTRAVALRLEGVDGRWQCTALTVG
ncbi:MAG: Rv3235 family protein [Actinomycetota bacterium]|nr:Rv3235 family protein [Actinomycetota bacterium]